ncbi:MAG: hypothetical protein HZC37_13420 [Burkholderiales bacterium]|nr:hypothetical protein [Burkholderiales bacterium]
MPRARYIPALLARHAEDLAFLWGQRRAALGSRLYRLRELNELGERIEAHLQGLLVAPAAELIERIDPALATGDCDEAFAAAYALLRLADAGATQRVVVEFSRAGGGALTGLRDALSFAPPALFVAEMQSALAQAKPATAAAAAVVLANHRLLDASSSRLAALVEHDDAHVAALAWRAAAAADALGAAPTRAARPYAAALKHDDAALRRAAWWAAAWGGHAAVLPLLRERSREGDGVALEGLAVLGAAEDAPLVQQLVLALQDGAVRCEVLARYGHPMALNALLRWMDPAAPALAAAAGEAFTRLTGHDVRGERRTLPVSDGADEFEREMAPAVWLPDVERARALLERHGEHWAGGTRWCAGARVDSELDREGLQRLDLEARWDAAARAAFSGRPVCAPPPIV